MKNRALRKTRGSRTFSRVLGMALLLGVSHSGCGAMRRDLGISPPNFAILDPNLTAQGANVLIEDSTFENVQLKEVVRVAPVDASSCGASNADGDLDEQLARFRACCSRDLPVCRLNRNSIQERLIAASNQRCGKFLVFLKQLQAEGTFFGKSTSIILSGLGSIFPAASTARALSGAAAIVQGTTSTFDESFYNQLAAQVVTEGIDARRTDLYERRIKVRQLEGVETYPLEAAIADAVLYHSSCNTMVGLRYAAAAVQKQKEADRANLYEVSDSAVIARETVISATEKIAGLKEQVEAASLGAVLTTAQTALKKTANEKLDSATKVVAANTEPVKEAAAKAAGYLQDNRVAATDADRNMALARFHEQVSRASVLAGEVTSALGVAQDAVSKFVVARKI